MKKVFVFTLGAALLLSSCDTYTGMGAYTGANIGGILGSAIGGLSGGWRGSDMGTLIGMAGGAAVGAAIGSAADQRDQGGYEHCRPQTDALGYRGHNLLRRISKYSVRPPRADQRGQPV